MSGAAGGDDVEALADLLSTHRLWFRETGRSIKNAWYCRCCRWVAVVVADGRDEAGVTYEDQHRRHLAGVLADRLRAERADGAREALKEAADRMSGVGSHRDPCRLPDTPCLCGVCDFRAAARADLRARAARLRAGQQGAEGDE